MCSNASRFHVATSFLSAGKGWTSLGPTHGEPGSTLRFETGEDDNRPVVRPFRALGMDPGTTPTVLRTGKVPQFDAIPGMGASSQNHMDSDPATPPTRPAGWNKEMGEKDPRLHGSATTQVKHVV
eukprot:scaffold44_cov339-Pavlova_lutheri.AAC.50